MPGTDILVLFASFLRHGQGFSQWSFFPFLPLVAALRDHHEADLPQLATGSLVSPLEAFRLFFQIFSGLFLLKNDTQYSTRYFKLKYTYKIR